MWRKWELQLVAAMAAIVAGLLLILGVRLCKLRMQQEQQRGGRYVRHHEGNSNLRQISMIPSRKGTVPVQAFDWKDHPALMSDALENGWSAFALSATASSANNSDKFLKPEMSWEVGPGTDFMQVIRLNPGLPAAEVSMRSMQFLKSALPLPGPFLGPYSYPQEAYFEVTVVGRHLWSGPAPATSGSIHHVENAKLVGKDISEADQLSPLGRIKSNRFISDSGRSRGLDAGSLSTSSVPVSSGVLAIGLVVGGSSAFGDIGSICYYSNGQVLVNGTIYADERFKKRPWVPGLSNTTVGCGYNPRMRKVFFTLNGDITCQVNCSKSEEFGYPLHAAFMSNYEVTLLVNFGQNSFEFLPENGSRVVDPGNHRPPPLRSLASGKAGGNSSLSNFQYDSGDLFSVGRLDSQCLDDSPALSQELQRPAPSEAESDLFEIVLDGDSEKVIHRP